jgi:hypothetical protein
MRYLVHIRTMQGKWLPIWAEPLPLESARDLAQTVRRCNRRDGFQPMAFWIRPIFAGHCSETMH